MIERAHRFALRVYWEDTDAGGIVYYANYLKFIERARSDMVRAGGLNQAVLLDDYGVMFAVRRCEIDFRRPACLEDELIVETLVRRLGGASVDLDQVVRRGEEELVSAKVRLACIGRDGRPKRMPAIARETMLKMQAGLDFAD